MLRLLSLDAYYAMWLFRSPEKLRAALENGMYPNAKTFDETPILHCAAAKHYDRCVEILLAYGARVNSVDSLGRNALFAVIKAGSPNMVSKLCDAGIAVDVEDIGGITPLAWCVGIAIESKKQKKDELRFNVLRCASILCQYGARVNRYADNYNSPLLIAVHDKDLELCNLFCKYEYDPDSVNMAGESPLLIAKKRESERVHRGA